MKRRLSIVAWLLAILAAGIYLAFKASRLFPYRAAFAGSYSYDLLFKSATWVLPVAALSGIFFGAMARRRTEPEVLNDSVLRHDDVAFLEHWTHVVGTLVLLVSGTYLGALFVPRMVHAPEAVGFALNMHFIGVAIFLFGIFYYLANAWIEGTIKEHLPQAGDFQDAIAHYKSILGVGKAPKEGKYLASEKLAYLGWAVVVGAIIITGAIKVSAHVWDLPAPLMGAITWLHDLSALGVAALLVAHVVAAAVVPWSWPLLKSMVTGYIPEEYVRKHHAKWYEQLQAGETGAEAPSVRRAGVQRPLPS